jgi:hypothetical protein
MHSYKEVKDKGDWEGCLVPFLERLGSFQQLPNVARFCRPSQSSGAESPPSKKDGHFPNRNMRASLVLKTDTSKVHHLRDGVRGTQSDLPVRFTRQISKSD